MSHPVPTLNGLSRQAKEVVVLAIEKNRRLATVESCTGGLLAHMVTEVPGASAVLHTGWVSYSNEAKSRFLEVPRETLMEKGAVSEEVAMALAEGGRTLSGVDVAVATTGIAGPTGATPGKPVGLMWCAVATKKETQTRRTVVEGHDRASTKRAFAGEALDLLREVLASK